MPPTVTVRPTPNPNSLKFEVRGAPVIASGMLAAGSAREAEGHPLAAALFALDGVANVFAVADFVTVTKAPSARWDTLAGAIERALLSHLDAPT